MNLLWIILGGAIILIFAVLGALLVIGLVVYRRRKKPKDAEVSPAQAEEITSTWNLLNH